MVSAYKQGVLDNEHTCSRADLERKKFCDERMKLNTWFLDIQRNRDISDLTFGDLYDD